MSPCSVTLLRLCFERIFVSTSRPSLYQVALHSALVVLAVLVVILVRQNHQLKSTQAESTRNAPARQLAAGEAPGPFSFYRLDGSEHRIDPAEPAMDRVFLVFTTTCPFCLETQTAWRTVHARLGEDAQVLGISLDDLDATRSYRAKLDLPFPVVVPTDPKAFAREYRISSVPLTLHIGTSGQVEGLWSGVLSEGEQGEILAAFGLQGDVGRAVSDLDLPQTEFEGSKATAHRSSP